MLHISLWSLNFPTFHRLSKAALRRVADKVQTWTSHLSGWWTGLSLTAFEVNCFCFLFSCRGSGAEVSCRLGNRAKVGPPLFHLAAAARCVWTCRSAADTVTLLLKTLLALNFFVSLSQSLKYFGFALSARICFYPPPRYIRLQFHLHEKITFSLLCFFLHLRSNSVKSPPNLLIPSLITLSQLLSHPLPPSNQLLQHHPPLWLFSFFILHPRTPVPLSSFSFLWPYFQSRQ